MPVTFRKTHNIYEYDSRNLIISYSVVILLTLLGIALGIFSFLDNGVAHSSAFSAIVATTRNPHLDIMSEGHSLGALPFDEHASRVKLRFGELVGTAKEDDDARHVGFGLEHDVVTMRKGGKYI